MPATWVDARFGEFTFDGVDRWEAEITASAFDVFRGDPWDEGRNAGNVTSNFRYGLIIRDEKGAIDRSAAVALAVKVLGNQVALVNTVTEAMWDDINGRGPDSGLWWHGDLNFAVEDTTGTKGSFLTQFCEKSGYPLNRSEDLWNVMVLRQIVIRHDVEGYDGFLAELCFEAAFELEHGVSLLTDGEGFWGLDMRLMFRCLREASECV